MHTVARCSGAIKAAFLEQPTLSEFYRQSAKAEEKKEREKEKVSAVLTSHFSG